MSASSELSVSKSEPPSHTDTVSTDTDTVSTDTDTVSTDTDTVSTDTDTVSTDTDTVSTDTDTVSVSDIVCVLSDPVCTTNMLKDIIDWLKLGDYVIIHNNGNNGHFYHKCPSSPGDNKDIKQHLKTMRVIYVNVSTDPSLLHEGEWPWYISDSGFKQCTCGLHQLVGTSKEIPHLYQFSVPNIYM
jgi:hypothetical protein